MAKASAISFHFTVSTPMPTHGCNSILPLPRGAQVIVLPPLPATFSMSLPDNFPLTLKRRVISVCISYAMSD
eukprot:1954459-Heterocapsa_arctica.AAC.1